MLLGFHLVDLTRYIGLLVTLMGAVATVPGAVRALTRGAVGAGRKSVLWARRAAARLIPRLRRVQVCIPDGIVVGVAVGEPRMRPGAGASIEYQLKLIWAELDVLTTHLRAFESSTSSRFEEVRSEIAETEARIARRDTKNTRVSALALFPIVLGVFLTVVPERFAAMPTVYWILLMAVLVFLAVRFSIGAFRVA